MREKIEKTSIVFPAARVLSEVRRRIIDNEIFSFRLSRRTDGYSQSKKPRMIIESSNKVPRTALLTRFPVSGNFGVAPESRIARGETWSASADAVRANPFEIYRYDPDSSKNPRLDIFEVDPDDCGSIVLGALFWIKNNVDSTLSFRRSKVRRLICVRIWNCSC